MKRNHRGRPGRQRNEFGARIEHIDAALTREFQQWYRIVNIETLPRSAWTGPFNYYKAMRNNGTSHASMLKQAQQPLYKHDEASNDLSIAGF